MIFSRIKNFSFLFLCLFFLGITNIAAQTATQNQSSTFEKCPEGQQPGGSNGEYCVNIHEPFVQEYNLKDNKVETVVSVQGKNGIEMFSSYIGTVYRYAASIIGIIAVLIMVISGIQIIAGGASSESVTEAKKRIFLAFSSLILLFMIGLLLKTINPGFFA